MVRACLDVVLQPLPCFGNGFHGILLEIQNSSPQGFGFAYGEEFGEERHRTFVPCVDSFPILVEPLFHPPQEREGKQAEPDAHGCDILDDDGVTQLKKVLEMRIHILISQTNGLPAPS